jgi:type IV pilus assembly protein PilA
MINFVMGKKILFKSIKNKSNEGFTMLEILLVVAMIAILAGIVIFAINPGKQLAEARNAQRRVDVNTILNAVYQYSIDSNGILPPSISTTPAEVCAVEQPPGDCSGYVDLSAILTNQKYLTGMPRDPIGDCPANSTCYSISISTNNRVTVSAARAELGAVISVTR